MTYEQYAISGVLCVALIGFIWGRWRYDIVAFVCLIAAVFLGVVPSAFAFSGFGHPATITVVAILILSRGEYFAQSFHRTGIAQRPAQDQNRDYGDRCGMAKS
jgi:hypothetical protein